jgi:hypothetical protein
MILDEKRKQHIQNVIQDCVRSKFKSYKRESGYMPFHHALFGKDRMALYSFMHSIATAFGGSVFEPVAVALAKDNFELVVKQYTVGNQISSEAQDEIQKIMNDLSVNGVPNKVEEIERIRAVCQKGTMRKLKPVKVDLFLQKHTGEIFLFDLKTVKPNAGNFKDYKRTLLEWIGITLGANPTATISSLVSIPYNPYYPQPYQRWTLKGMLDATQEFKVAEEFWDFLGGENAYTDLLECFESAGIVMRSEIDEYFTRFKT